MRKGSTERKWARAAEKWEALIAPNNTIYRDWLIKGKLECWSNTPVYHIETPVFYSFWQELEEIRKSGMKNFRNIQVDESNILTWQGLIVPVSSISCSDLTKCFVSFCFYSKSSLSTSLCMLTQSKGGSVRQFSFTFSLFVSQMMYANFRMVWIFLWSNLPHSLGQPSIWQRGIQDRDHLPCRIPFQTPKDHVQNKDLPPQHWRERASLSACN